MKTVGQTLRSAREKKQIELDVAASILKIRIRYLEALERGDFSIFPSPLYAKGFLKNYAKYLGIEETEVLALYRREETPQIKQKSVVEDLQIKSLVKPVRFTVKPGFIVALFTICLICVVFIYLFIQFRTIAVPPNLKISAPSQNEIVKSSVITINGNTNGNKITINNVPVPFISDNGDFTTNITLHTGINDVIFTATNSFNRSVTIKKTVIYTDKGVNTPQVSQTPITTTLGLNARLVINNETTWVKVIGDDKILFEGVLPPGTIKNYNAQLNLIIDTGRSSDTILSVNGQNIPFVGDGVIEHTITLTQTGTLAIR